MYNIDSVVKEYHASTVNWETYDIYPIKEHYMTK